MLLSLSLSLPALSLFLFRFLSHVLPVRHGLHTIARIRAYFIMTAIEINVARNANSIINYAAMIVRHFVVYYVDTTPPRPLRISTGARY